MEHPYIIFKEQRQLNIPILIGTNIEEANYLYNISLIDL